MNFLALLGWHPAGDNEVLTPDDLVREFSLARVQKGGAQFDEAKLRHLNRAHLRKLSDDEFLQKSGITAADEARLRRALPVIRERAYTLKEAQEMLQSELLWLRDAPMLDREVLLAKGDTAKGHLAEFVHMLEALHEDMSAGDIKRALMPYADSIPKDAGGRGAALWPLRYALSGAERSPDPFTLIHILGGEESKARLHAAIEQLS